MVWSDDTPAEVSDGAPYNGWNPNEPSSQANEDCAYLNVDQQGWNDNMCDHSPYGGPYVLCQKERKKDGSSKAEG